MQGNKISYITTLFALVFMLNSNCFSQELNSRGRGKYSLVAYIGGGPSYYALNAATPTFVTAQTNKLGFAGTVRVLWHPDHLVRLGLESGHMEFYSYKFKDSVNNQGKNYVSGVPILLVASMPLTKRWNIFGGLGFYSLSTHLEYLGKNYSQKLSLGWMGAVSYIQPLSEKLGVATELKWLDANETKDAVICVQLQLVWKFITW